MNTTATSPAAAPVDAKQRLTKKLPTFRVGFQKQMDALRAYAMLSDNGTKPVHYTRIAEIIKVHEANVSSMNPFFVEAGLIVKASNGYLPVPQVLDYNRAYSWNQETAASQLRQLIGDSWFGIEIGQRLAFRPMSEDAALEVLAAKCNAGPEAKPQLRILLDFCQAAGIIDRANGQLTLGAVSGPANLEPPLDEATPVRAAERPQESQGQQGFRSTASESAGASSKAGAINLDISIQVDLAEMRDWSPDRITSFFGGVAQILAAKNQSG
jgi:hypothetical protein